MSSGGKSVEETADCVPSAPDCAPPVLGMALNSEECGGSSSPIRTRTHPHGRASGGVALARGRECVRGWFGTKADQTGQNLTIFARSPRRAPKPKIQTKSWQKMSRKRAETPKFSLVSVAFFAGFARRSVFGKICSRCARRSVFTPSRVARGSPKLKQNLGKK